MILHGINKLTLLDYPEHMACTLFTGNCNLRCPFCQNAPLVLFPDSQPAIDDRELWAFLKKRQGILEGVCLTGGEPTLSSDLPDFLEKIKALGYLTKLDTNGTQPDMLQTVVKRRLVDYVAMDIKSSPARYSAAAGLSEMNLAPILESADFLMHSGIPYEFRTTVVKQLHDRNVLLEIAAWLKGADAYYLQAFEDSGELLVNYLSFPKLPEKLSGYSKEELESFLTLVRPYFKQVGLRGIA